MPARMRALVAGASLLVGCSLATSLDELGGGDGDAGDASDAGSNEAAAPEAGGNLVQNPSFDDGQGGCGPGWGNGYGMTFTRVSPGRTGPYACEVCITTGPQDSFELQTSQPISVQAGVSYYGEAWVMTPDGGVAVDAGVGVLLDYDIDAGISACNGIGNICQGSIIVDPPSSWEKTTASFVANGSGTVTVHMHAYGSTPSSCFVVDDVALYAQ